MKQLFLKILVAFSTLAFVFIASAQVVVPLGEEFYVIPFSDQSKGGNYFNDFSNAADGDRIDQFVAYRDPFVVTHTTGRSDHASTGGVNCTLPEQTRPQTRENPLAHVYQCLPMGNPDAGHQMAFAMDTSGYGFAGALPDKVFEEVTEVSVDVNATNAGGRNFVEIKVIPADNVYVNGMPCIRDLPCNGGWDYDDIGAVGAARMRIATVAEPDGYTFNHYDSIQLDNGDKQYNQCPDTGYCHRVRTHVDTLGIRERYQHIFRDNGDGTLAFGIEAADGHFDWIVAPGSFPKGSVRVVIAFHNYTGTKSNNGTTNDNGPGANGNVSPSEGGFTWHWDELSVVAKKSTPAVKYFGGHNADRIVTPDDCIAFSQGQRLNNSNKDVLPRFHCEGDADINF